VSKPPGESQALCTHRVAGKITHGDEARHNRENTSLMASIQFSVCRESLEAMSEWLSAHQVECRAALLMSGPSFRRVLVGFDGSPDALEALRVAAAIVGADGGHVVALSVVRQPSRHEGDQSETSESEALRSLAENRLAELRQSQRPPGAVRTSVQVVFSDRPNPGQVVSDYAAEHGFDILVLGRRGDGTTRRSRLGRVADTAAHGCQVPVLLLSAP